MRQDMTKRIATKDSYEKEQEESERLVKPSPKKKPPRHDKTRTKMKTDDKDIGSDVVGDKDMSMNFKDIGGSIVAKVLNRYAFDFDPDEFDPDAFDDDDDADNEEDSDDGGWDEESDSSDDEDDEDRKEETPETKKYRPPSDEEIKRHAIRLYDNPVSKLQDMLGDDQYSEAEQTSIEMALVLKTELFPPSWDKEKFFKEGVLTLEARQLFRKHMQNWDTYHFASHLNKLKEKRLNDSIVSGKDESQTYFNVLVDIVSKEWEDFRKEDIKPVQKLDDFLVGLPFTNDEFKSSDKKDLDKASEQWKNRLRRTSFKTSCSILKALENQIEDEHETLSVRYAYLLKLSKVLKGAIAMKKILEDSESKNKKEGFLISAAIRSGFNKASFKGMAGRYPEGRRPEVTSWDSKLPRKLTVDDHARIIAEAMIKLQSDFLKHDLLDYNKEVAASAALDMTIWSLDNGKFHSVVDAPTYKALLAILMENV